MDESGDLTALSRTPITVVSAGVKSILDIPATLERLETLGVAVAGYRTNRFPAFYLTDSGEDLDWRVDSPAQIAAAMSARDELGETSALLIANPLPPERQLDPELHAKVLADALAAAESAGIRGKAVTPFLLEQMQRATGGASVAVNLDVARGNIALAGQIATAWSARQTQARLPPCRKARVWPLPQGHVHPDNGSVLVGPQVHPVAYLAYQPQAVPAVRVARRRLASGPRVRDETGVPHLADHLVRGEPDLHRARRVRMPDRVRRHLADRDHEVGDPAGGQPGRPGVLFRQGAYLRQVRGVDEGHGIKGWRRGPSPPGNRGMPVTLHGRATSWAGVVEARSSDGWHCQADVRASHVARTETPVPPPPAQHLAGGYATSVLTAAVISPSAFFASAKYMLVFGLTYSSLSMPA
jgi:hypothetical protein